MVEDSFTAFLVGSFVSLITIINPPATLPIFTSVTSSLDADATRRTATSASIYCFCILVGSLFAGSLIMKAFGISYGAMRVAGGMIIASIGKRGGQHPQPALLPVSRYYSRPNHADGRRRNQRQMGQ